MTYECKIYDAKGRLKKIVNHKEALTKLTKNFLSQKSTKKSSKFIENFKHGKQQKYWSQKFYTKTCEFCEKEFYCRHPKAKYCSHECQKRKYYLRNKSKRETAPGRG